jgi:hypothetical protein
VKQTVGAVLLLLLNVVAGAHAAEPGMFLCRSPVVANDFWTDLNTAQQTGIKLNKELAGSIAQKNACPFVASASFSVTPCPRTTSYHVARTLSVMSETIVFACSSSRRKRVCCESTFFALAKRP